MSEPFTRHSLTELMNMQRQPCLSVYMPTHRSFPDSEQNPIRYRNLLKKLREQVTARFPDADQTKLLQPFEALLDDREFWAHPTDAIAVLGTEDTFKRYSLNRPVPERAVASVHPYLSPLLRIVQSADSYQVLCLSRDNVRLFEGNRDTLNEVKLAKQVPLNQVDALGSDLTEGDQSGRPDGFGAAAQRGDPLMHGAGGLGKQHEIDLDRERFFRALDRAITEHHSKPSGLPLVLVALPENQAAFRDVTHNQQLMKQGIDIDPATLSSADLRSQSWDVMLKHYQKRLAGLVEQFGGAQGQGLGSDQIDDIGKAALAGRVATMLVEADRMIPGTFDHDSGSVTTTDDSDGKTDVLDELMVHAMRNGADVVIVPAENMPTKSGAAAVYRF